MIPRRDWLAIGSAFTGLFFVALSLLGVVLIVAKAVTR